MLHLLSTTPPPPPEHYTKLDALMWGAILLGFVLLGGVLLMFFKARLTHDPDQDADSGGFSLADLRKLRDRGELTPEEFEVAKAKTVARMQANLEAAEKAREKSKKKGA